MAELRRKRYCHICNAPEWHPYSRPGVRYDPHEYDPGDRRREDRGRGARRPDNGDELRRGGMRLHAYHPGDLGSSRDSG